MFPTTDSSTLTALRADGDNLFSYSPETEITNSELIKGGPRNEDAIANTDWYRYVPWDFCLAVTN